MTINEYRSNRYEEQHKNILKCLLSTKMQCFSQCLCFTNIMLLNICVVLWFETAINLY
jgi:hypothetical protein